MIPFVHPAPPPGNPFAASIVAAPPVATPSAPHAGERFTVSIRVRRSDTGAPVAFGHVSCGLSVGTTPAVRLRRTLRASTASCAWRLPANVGGLLRAYVQVTVPAGSTERVVTLRVR